MKIIKFIVEKLQEFVWKIQDKYETTKQFIQWLPIIWKDRQWDEYYLFKILQHKFKLMEEFFNSKYAHCVGSKRRAKKLKICRILCERMIEEDYTTMYDKRFEPIFDKFCEALRNPVKDKDNPCIVRIVCDKTELERKISIWKAKAEDKARQRDIELLCKIIERNVFDWWD